MTIKDLYKMGFIRKHLFADWYIVSLYARGWRKFIMFPMKLKNLKRSGGKKRWKTTETKS